MSGENGAFYRKLRRFSLLYDHFAFLDIEDHAAEPLFRRHRAAVRFELEYRKPGMAYHIIFCRVRRRDVRRFREAMAELPDRLALLGHPNYLAACRAVWEGVEKGGAEDRIP